MLYCRYNLWRLRLEYPQRRILESAHEKPPWIAVYLRGHPGGGLKYFGGKSGYSPHHTKFWRRNWTIQTASFRFCSRRPIFNPGRDRNWGHGICLPCSGFTFSKCRETCRGKGDDQSSPGSDGSADDYPEFRERSQYSGYPQPCCNPENF